MDLQGFDFKGEDVSGANLSYADLRGTNLTDADLSGARLRRALYDNSTQFPRGFRADARGAYAVVPQAKIRFAKMAWMHLHRAELSGAADLSPVDRSTLMANVGFGQPVVFSRRTGRGCHGEAEALLGGAEVPGRVGVAPAETT